MPGFDRTGPMGGGPMTGGRRGLCFQANTGMSSGYVGDPSLARGFRGRRGPGRGFGRGGIFYPSVNAMAGQDEVGMLKSQAAGLQQSLDAINQRLEEIEGSVE
ncbi:MAG: DUF5320 family protein [Thermodesulfobacteriota bacterium]|nr:DUF5320 family protein [Thermodesulfobacteriota bacterium]